MTYRDDLILVTGASGFLGSAVVRALLARGARCRVLVRSASPRENLAGLGLDIVEGDLRDGASVRRAMEGVRFAFNVAADYRLWAPDPEEIVRNNRLAADNVVEAALACGSSGWSTPVRSPRSSRSTGALRTKTTRPPNRPWWGPTSAPRLSPNA
jgi:uncharacterized protein YbjT (DUF2867 family)